MLLLMLFMSMVAGKEVFRNDNDEEKKVWKAEMVTDKMRRHCSSPSGEYMMFRFRLFKSLLLGSVDGKILVEDDGGQMSDFTTLTWQIGLGETLCYKFKSETSSVSGTVEVSYQSQASIIRTDQSQSSIAGELRGTEEYLLHHGHLQVPPGEEQCPVRV